MERLKNLFGKLSVPANRGEQAEAIALDHLRKHGLRLLERNYRCRNGEIDLIMDDSGTLVFVEVRFRSLSSFGGALESVDARKRGRIIRTASHYLSRHRGAQPTRFDVIAIAPNQQRLDIDWVQDAFQI